MNAGCFGKEFKDILLSIQAIDKLGNVITIPRDDIIFEYRKNNLPNDMIFLSASFKGRKESLINIKNEPLFENISTTSKFYFVHGYYFKIDNNENVLAETDYEITFPSVIKKENIVGTQFHPEKSQNHGIQFLYNFLKINKLI